jgi:hypothetical protein
MEGVFVPISRRWRCARKPVRRSQRAPPSMTSRSCRCYRRISARRWTSGRQRPTNLYIVSVTSAITTDESEAVLGRIDPPWRHICGCTDRGGPRTGRRRPRPIGSARAPSWAGSTPPSCNASPRRCRVVRRQRKCNHHCMRRPFLAPLARTSRSYSLRCSCLGRWI